MKYDNVRKNQKYVTAVTYDDIFNFLISIYLSFLVILKVNILFELLSPSLNFHYYNYIVLNAGGGGEVNFKSALSFHGKREVNSGYGSEMSEQCNSNITKRSRDHHWTKWYFWSLLNSQEYFLTRSFPMQPFSTPENIRKSYGFLMFSGSGEKVHWEQMG